MKGLLKIAIILALVFASTFIVARLTGVFSIEEIQLWFEWAQTIDPFLIFALVALLLFSDLFIAVPTLTITILSGYFLGFPLGSLSAITGMYMAGIAGYFLTRRYGDRILRTILKNEEKRKDAVETFHKYGFLMILLSRVSPILPEVSACMAGITGMGFRRFLLAWTINSVPYALIASYSGSISSLDNPKPAIYTAIIIYATLWIGWLIMKKSMGKTQSSDNTSTTNEKRI
jgi:uncharacterized membrane protein YdjX (TVP38/TMEM64 family)